MTTEKNLDFRVKRADAELLDSLERVLLWPNGTPDDTHEPAEEVKQDSGEDFFDRWIHNIHIPTLTLHLPPPERATGAAAVICPGGGYAFLSIDKEGHEIARWLNTFGVAGLVLTHRLARGEGYVHGHEIPLQDAQRAMRLARLNAEAWGLNPSRIGMIGFSAGAHLTASVATNYKTPIPDAMGEGDDISTRPDFTALIYPVISCTQELRSIFTSRYLLGLEPDEALRERYSNQLHVTDETPPAFIVHTNDDQLIYHSMAYHRAMLEANAPCEMHIYNSGGHGYGMRQTGAPVCSWPLRCEEWIKRTLNL